MKQYIQYDFNNIPVKGFVVENSATEPTPAVEGRMYYDTVLDKLRQYQNGAWVTLGSGSVVSVAGKTGVVVLVKADVGLSNVDNTTDLNKPISTATQTALNAKVDKVVYDGFVDQMAITISSIENEVDTKATLAQVNAAVAALVDGAPGAIDTLNELAAALGDDPNFATTMTNALAGKASTTHGHALTDAGITGILPLAKGGTGQNATSTADLKNKLGIKGSNVINWSGALTAGAWSASFNHGLGSMAPSVTFYETASLEQVMLDVKVIDSNNIQIRSDVAVPVNTLTVAVQG